MSNLLNLDYNTKAVIGWSMLAVVAALTILFLAHFVWLVMSQRKDDTLALPELTLSGDDKKKEQQTESTAAPTGPAPAFTISAPDDGDLLLEEARAAAAEIAAEGDNGATRQVKSRFSLRKN